MGSAWRRSAFRSTRQTLTWEHSGMVSPFKIASLAGISLIAVFALTGCINPGSGSEVAPNVFARG